MKKGKFSAVSSCAAVTALLIAAISVEAHAETLIYVTADTIGTVDSSAPSADNTPGSNGALIYDLPDGYNTLGAKVSIDGQSLYLLSGNGSSCQLYMVNATGFSNSGSMSGGVAVLTAVDSPYACSYPAGTGDIAFVAGSGSLTVPDEYLIADAGSVQEVPANGGNPTPISFTNASGGTADLVGVAAAGSPTTTVYGIDAGTAELVQLNLTSGTESSPVALGFTPSGFTSLDYSETSGALYLYTSGLLYSSSPASTALAPIGPPPFGSIAVVAADLVTVNNPSATGTGAFPPAILLSLLGLAGLRAVWGRRFGKA